MGNELHTMPWRLEKFFASDYVRRLEWDERGAYIILLGEAWLQGGRLSSDIEEIRRTLQIPQGDDWQRIVRYVIEPKFPLSPCGTYRYNDTQVEIYQETQGKVSRNRENAQKAALAKWNNGNMRAHTEKDAGAMRAHIKTDADAMRPHVNQSQSQSQSQSQIAISEPKGSFDKQKEEYICSEPGSPAPEPTAAIPPKRKRSEHLEKFKFDWDKLDWDWEAIPQEWADAMKVAYPAVNICLEMERAKAWLIANPTKAKLNNCRFLTNWFRTTQEKGGTKG